MLAQDACNNEFEAGEMYEGEISASFETPGDTNDPYVTVGSYEPTNTTKLNFATRTEDICLDPTAEPYDANGYIAWTGVASPDYAKVAYTSDGYVAAAGTTDDEILNLDFYETDGTSAAAKFYVDFDTPIYFDMTAADYSTGGVAIGVVEVFNGNAYVYHVTKNGQQWTEAHVIGDSLDNPRVYSNNNRLHFGFQDTVSVDSFYYDLADGSLDGSVNIGVTDEVYYLEAVYIDDSGNTYTLGAYDDEIVNDLLQLVAVDSTGESMIYERDLSSSSFTGQATRIVECESDLCFAASFSDYNRVFQADLATGVLQKEVQYATNLQINDITASGSEVFVTGEDTDDTEGFATSLTPSTSTINWNKAYDDALGAFGYKSIAAGTGTVAIAGYGNARLYTTLVDKATGSINKNKKINIEGNDFDIYAAMITLYYGNYYFFTGYDYAPLSGITGRLNGFSDEPAVPEFSLTTLLIATLLTAGTILLTRRRK